ncbi:MAG: DUF4282 domain-containing protein [Propionibacteriaceae bacterium]|nr:DUF4282 domain-containing protein [Propionibacteriaceae bacterium]
MSDHQNPNDPYNQPSANQPDPQPWGQQSANPPEAQQPWGQPSANPADAQPWGQQSADPYAAQQPWGTQPQQPADQWGGQWGQQQADPNAGQWGQQQADPNTGQWGQQQWDTAPGKQANMLANDGKGLFKALFDFSFSSFVTPKIIKVVYMVLTVAIGLGILGSIITAFSTRSVLAILAALIFAPLAGLIYLALARMTMELYYAVIRLSEDVHERLPRP